MPRTTSESPLRVLLVNKTLYSKTNPAWATARAPWALGAFCLRSYIESLPALAPCVDIEIRSFPSDASDLLVLEEIRSARPHVVGFTSQPWNYIDNIRLSRTISRLSPEITVIHGGPMVIDRGQYLQRAGPSVRIAVEGEAEETFADLMACFALADRPLSGIRGIAYFDEELRQHVNEARPNPDLASLPPVMTARNLADMGPAVLYETARGCPFRCSFCNWGSQKARLRTRRPEVVEADLKAILEHAGTRDVWITDAGIDIAVEHATFVADVVSRYRQTDVLVSAYVFLLHRDLSYVARMVGGIDQLQVGLQTANEHSLSEMGRKALSPERFDRILDAVLPCYPGLRVDLLYGLPHIGLDELEKSVRFLLGKGIWLMNLFRLVAIPGTDLADHREKYGIVAEEEFPFTIYASEGCTADEMFRMHQFKVNMDTVRWVFANDGYRKALARGVDLVSFARQLHVAIPRLNYLGAYDDDIFDQRPSPELVHELLAAGEQADGSGWLGGFMLEQMRSAGIPVPEQPARPRAAWPRGDGPDTPRRSRQPADLRDGTVVRILDPSAEWTLHVERASDDRQYFRVVGDLGLYYRTEPGSRPEMDRVEHLMSAVAAQIEAASRTRRSSDGVSDAVIEYLQSAGPAIQIRVERQMRPSVGLPVLPAA